MTVKVNALTKNVQCSRKHTPPPLQSTLGAQQAIGGTQLLPEVTRQTDVMLGNHWPSQASASPEALHGTAEVSDSVTPRPGPAESEG